MVSGWEMMVGQANLFIFGWETMVFLVAVPLHERFRSASGPEMLMSGRFPVVKFRFLIVIHRIPDGKSGFTVVKRFFSTISRREMIEILRSLSVKTAFTSITCPFASDASEIPQICRSEN